MFALKLAAQRYITNGNYNAHRVHRASLQNITPDDDNPVTMICIVHGMM